MGNLTKQEILTAYEWLGLTVQQLKPALTLSESVEIHDWSRRVFERLGLSEVAPTHEEWPASSSGVWDSMK